MYPWYSFEMSEKACWDAIKNKGIDFKISIPKGIGIQKYRLRTNINVLNHTAQVRNVVFQYGVLRCN